MTTVTTNICDNCGADLGLNGGGEYYVPSGLKQLTHIAHEYDPDFHRYLHLCDDCIPGASMGQTHCDICGSDTQPLFRFRPESAGDGIPFNCCIDCSGWVDNTQEKEQ